MKRFSAIFAVLLLAGTLDIQAQGVFTLPAIKSLNIPRLDGVRPAEVRVPVPDVLETYRKTRVVIPLGSRDYHLSIQRVRAEEWVLALLPVGKNKFDLEASFTFASLRKGIEHSFAGRTYQLTLDEDSAVRFQALDNPLGGMRVPLSVLKRGVWEQGVPLPALGPDWRLLFQIDLWRGAGMRSFVFLKRAGGDVEFYRTGAEGVDWTRSVVRDIGGEKVSLRLDLGEEKGFLVVTPKPADTPVGPLQP